MALTIRPDAEMIKELDIMKESYQIATNAGMIKKIVMDYQSLKSDQISAEVKYQEQKDLNIELLNLIKSYQNNISEKNEIDSKMKLILDGA